MRQVTYKYFHYLINFFVYIKNVFSLKYFYLKKRIKKKSSISEVDYDWKLVFKSFLNCRYDIKYFDNFISGIYDSKLESFNLKIIDSSKPVLICVIKNEVTKLEKLLYHYKSLGITNFVFIDNDSKDGTFEKLLNEGCCVFEAKDSFNTARKVGWINQVMQRIGRNKWYLIIDSDEFLYTYNKVSIDSLTSLKPFRSYGAVMVDMYKANNSDEFISFDNFFRTNYHRDFKAIYGGMRERVFNCTPLIKKHPLFLFSKNVVMINCHYLYPYSRNFRAPLQLVLLHYKDYNSDIEKIRKIVADGSYANNSSEYKRYLRYFEQHETIPSGEHTVTFSGQDQINEILNKLLDK